jgi:hypothetical protein
MWILRYSVSVERPGFTSSAGHGADGDGDALGLADGDALAVGVGHAPDEGDPESLTDGVGDCPRDGVTRNAAIRAARSPAVPRREASFTRYAAVLGRGWTFPLATRALPDNGPRALFYCLRRLACKVASATTVPIAGSGKFATVGWQRLGLLSRSFRVARGNVGVGETIRRWGPSAGWPEPTARDMMRAGRTGANRTRRVRHLWANPTVILPKASKKAWKRWL